MSSGSLIKRTLHARHDIAVATGAGRRRVPGAGREPMLASMVEWRAPMLDWLAKWSDSVLRATLSVMTLTLRFADLLGVGVSP